MHLIPKVALGLISNYSRCVKRCKSRLAAKQCYIYCPGFYSGSDIELPGPVQVQIMVM